MDRSLLGSLIAAAVLRIFVSALGRPTIATAITFGALGVNALGNWTLVFGNLGIGLCTPPVGTALFTGCAIAGRKIESVSKATLPLYVPMLVVLLLVTYIPGLTMALPNLLMK